LVFVQPCASTTTDGRRPKPGGNETSRRKDEGETGAARIAERRSRLRPEQQRQSFTVTREVRWSSTTATDADVAQVEVEMIRRYRSKDPAIGYNRWPRFRPPT
jgi:hypothetical protein